MQMTKNLYTSRMGPSIHVRFSNTTGFGSFQPAQQQSYTTEMSPEISLTVREVP